MRAERTGGSGNGSEGSDVAESEVSAAALFTILWSSLADVLGTAATAALVRRAARGATGRCPELAALLIVREGAEYRCSVPKAWKDSSEVTPTALRELVDELRPILVEMTGAVVVTHLARIPQLQNRGMVFLPEEEQP